LRNDILVRRSKKTVSVENLEALGAKRLAEMLFELGLDDTGIKRRLRLELASEVGGEAIAADIGKRLAELKRARSFVDWHKRRALVKDIDLQRQMIVEKVAATRPNVALDLMWRFMELAGPVLDRMDDSYGDVGDVFRRACEDLGAIAAKATPDPVRLADRVFEAVSTNDYGEYDGLTAVIFPALQESGVSRLEERLRSALVELSKTDDGYDFKGSVLRRALQDIADGRGDIDAFIALQGAASRRSPRMAAEIAERLLRVNRPEEAIRVLQGAAQEEGGFSSFEWDSAWVEALLATGQREEAQRFRWSRFEQRLDATCLRAYLKALPDFDDDVAETKALDYATAFSSFATALSFLSGWPALRHAAKLVLERRGEIDGNVYFILDPAAKALEGKHPLAAVLLRRAMIDDALDGAKSKRYGYAARHILECRALDASIADYGEIEDHDAFVARLRAKHGRKTGFWGRLAELSG
jgi:hypothetical protein